MFYAKPLHLLKETLASYTYIHKQGLSKHPVPVIYLYNVGSESTLKINLFSTLLPSLQKDKNETMLQANKKKDWVAECFHRL